MSRIFMRTEKCSCIQYFVQYMCIPYTHTYGIHFGFVYVFFFIFLLFLIPWHFISFHIFFFQYTIYVVQEWKGEQKKNTGKNLYFFLHTFVYSISNAFSDFYLNWAPLPFLKWVFFFTSYALFRIWCLCLYVLLIFLKKKNYFACVYLFICSAHLSLNNIQLHSKCLLCVKHTYTNTQTHKYTAPIHIHRCL